MGCINVSDQIQLLPLTHSILCNTKMAKSQTLEQKKFLQHSFYIVLCDTPQIIKVWPKGCPKIISEDGTTEFHA